MNTLSSHVLDTTLGKPAQGIALTLTLPDGSTLSGETDNDGRFNNWGVE
ncbi:MAG: 5-hydroxyisourate hydrolase, partial [Alteromonadales bacterium]